MLVNSIPYIIFIVLLFFLSLPVCQNIGNQNYIISISYKCFRYSYIGMIFLIFIGFRGYIYTDWIAYTDFFYKCPTLFSGEQIPLEYEKWEKGFVLYVQIIKTICPSYCFFQFISCFIDFIIVWNFFNRYIPKYVGFGFFFFILFSGFGLEINLMRNQKSVMFFLLSIQYLEEKKFFRYFMLNIIGCLFHISSVFYLPLYFILKKKINRRFILFLFILGNIVFLFQIHWIKGIIAFFSGWMPGRLGIMTIGYLQSENFSSAYGFTVGYIERFCSFIWIYKNLKKSKFKEEFILFVNIFLIYIYIYLFCSEMFILLDRLPLLFASGYWILFPKSYENMKRKSKRNFLIIIFCYAILKMALAGANPISKYDNVLFNKYSYDERVSTIRAYKGR